MRVVVLSGEGPSFCAGLDFGSFQQMAGGGSAARTEAAGKQPRRDMAEGRITHLGQQVAWVWQELAVPVIAAVHGHALGGGFQIALGADIRIVRARRPALGARGPLGPRARHDRHVRPQPARAARRRQGARRSPAQGRQRHGGATTSGSPPTLTPNPCEDALALAREIAGPQPGGGPRRRRHLLNVAPLADAAAQFAEERRVIGGLIGTPNQVEAVMANFERRDGLHRLSRPWLGDLRSCTSSECWEAVGAVARAGDVAPWRGLNPAPRCKFAGPPTSTHGFRRDVEQEGLDGTRRIKLTENGSSSMLVLHASGQRRPLRPPSRYPTPWIEDDVKLYLASRASTTRASSTTPAASRSWSTSRVGPATTIVQTGLGALCNLEHRGASGAEAEHRRRRRHPRSRCPTGSCGPSPASSCRRPAPTPSGSPSCPVDAEEADKAAAAVEAIVGRRGPRRCSAGATCRSTRRRSARRPRAVMPAFRQLFVADPGGATGHRPRPQAVLRPQADRARADDLERRRASTSRRCRAAPSSTRAC